MAEEERIAGLERLYAANDVPLRRAAGETWAVALRVETDDAAVGLVVTYDEAEEEA
jgi:hypothetical protein